MRKILMALVLLLVSALYAGETDSQPYIRNVCDSLVTSGAPVVPLTAAYIDESNWYGNPHTWNTDSTSFNRHEDYRTLTVATKNFAYKLPISVNAECRETRGNELSYATWNSDKAWVVKSDDDIATYIFDIHAQKFGAYDSTNANNLLAIVPGMIPEDDVYKSGQMLVSAPFELSFEWWFVGLSYKLVKTIVHDEFSSTTSTQNFYGNAVSYDSLSAFRAAYAAISENIPDTVKTLRIQAVKVVLKDSRKKAEEPESSGGVASSSSLSEQLLSSSSSEPLSSSSSSAVNSSGDGAVESSSGEEPVSSSNGESSAESSSSEAPASSESGPATSSSEEPESSGGVASSSSSSEQLLSSSSSELLSSSSSSAVNSSGDGAVESCSGEEPVSSSSGESPAESSSSEAPASSESGPDTSSSEKFDAVVLRANEKSGANEVLQVRSLDGTLVKSSNFAPGIYYVKTSAGTWRKMAVLPK